MQEKNLEKIKTEIIDTILHSNIDLTDKVELMMNIHQFLSNYNENIKILKLYYDNKKEV